MLHEITAYTADERAGRAENVRHLKKIKTAAFL